DGEVALDQPLALVDGSRLRTAVDAGVAVAHQYPSTTPVCLPARYIYVSPQRNHRRHGEFIAHRAEELVGLLDHDCLLRQQQIDRAWDSDDRKQIGRASLRE